MHTNTLKTILGFFRSVINMRTLFKQKNDSIESVYNYLLIDNLFVTSDQPSENQFELIRDAGFETIINLAPNSVLENSVVNETEVLANLGMKYIHIPVDFKNPTEDDFAKFVSCVQDHEERKVWFHCAANMRVSAFTYRYRYEVLGEDQVVAEHDLRKIWEPIGVWKKFIKQ